MPTLQDTVARRMIIAGTGAMVFGMVYGTQIHDETFGNSSAMLYGHGQLLLNGLHQLVGGMLLFFPQICKFNSSGALKLIEYGNVYAPTLVYCVDFWGAMNGVSWPRVLREGGLEPLAKDDFRFKIYSINHYIPGVLYLVTWVMILYGCITTKTSDNQENKGKVE